VFGFQWLPFLQKGRNTNREPVHMDADKQLLTGLDNVPEEISEDIQLMRGSCRSERWSKSLTCFKGIYSRVTIILLSRMVFIKDQDVSVDIEQR